MFICVLAAEPVFTGFWACQRIVRVKCQVRNCHWFSTIGWRPIGFGNSPGGTANARRVWRVAFGSASALCWVAARALQCVLIGHMLCEFARAQDTPDYFRQNCMNCHTIGGGRLTGPDLKDVTGRKEREWLIRFMMDPKAVIDSGDPYARQILEESRNVPMPKLAGLTQDRAERLLDLIDAESKLEKSQFKGLAISTRPFTAEDRALGRRLFIGQTRLAAGGAACLACHSAHDQPAIGGGRLGPDLTRVYERLKGRQSPAFKNHPLTPEEIHALVAWFEHLAPRAEPDASARRITFLLLGLSVAVGLLFALDGAWSRRFRSVRGALVDAAKHAAAGTPARPLSHKVNGSNP
jgi:mono/diheme cytochrome c family protein